jgi:predicted nucleotidyltransferase
MLAALVMPAKVVVFGSYGRGDADKGSDVDLLVLAQDLSDKSNLYLKLKSVIGRVGIGVDLVLMTVADFEKRVQVLGTLAYWASKEGQVYYDTLS